jgi:hypothetical protein
MYIYFGSSIEGTIILLVVSIALTALIIGILGLSAYILVVLNNIKRYIKRRGDK